jgi:PIN domain nuclease of toxin-antitoxin system
MKEEKQTESEIMLDSSIWMAYLLEGSYQEIVENKKTIFVSTLSIFEIKKKLLDRKVPIKEVNEKIGYIKERAISIPIDKRIAENAAELAEKNKIPAIDSLIYASSRLNNCNLITRDNEFRNLPNAQVLD